MSKMQKEDIAIQRLAWRFTSNTSFKPSEKDVEALNCIIEWMNRQSKESVLNNSLFAKLYIYNLNQTIRHYGATVFDDICQKDLSRLLDTPIEHFYTAFHKELQSNNTIRVVEDSTIARDQIISELKEKYTLKKVTTELDFMINEALKTFK